MLQVVPFSPSSGLLEWVEHTLPIADYLLSPNRLGGAHARYKRPGDLTWYDCYQKVGGGLGGGAGACSWVHTCVTGGGVVAAASQHCKLLVDHLLAACWHQRMNALASTSCKRTRIRLPPSPPSLLLSCPSR